MRQIPVLLFLILSVTCEKDDIGLKKNSKVKTRYIFSGSTDDKPYSFATYTYDNNWNLIKELISDYPKPVFASESYEYSEDGRLISRQRRAIEGENHTDQTEADFTLIWEKKYEYRGNRKIEKEYRNNIVKDSSVYTYDNNLLTEEYHYNIENHTEWGTLYEYNPDNLLIKTTSYPEGYYTKYIYQDSKIEKTLHFNNNDSILGENLFVYTFRDSKEIRETHNIGTNGEFISEKITSINGNVLEYIKYHPTFIGAEWWCEKYEYY